LRVLENGEVKRVGSSRPFHVDVRVVAATNRDLLNEARRGRFRMDLYYRLSIVPLGLPPLRERGKDIRLLAEYFLRVYTPREQTVKFTPAALTRFQQHTWPGNVRELRNVVCRALLLRQSQKIEADAITFEQESAHEPGGTEGRGLELPEGMTLEQMLQLVERQLIESTLRRCDYHKDKAAKLLGLARSSLFERLKKWGHDEGEEET
jgi:DNA-binding NtrC family response regulator